MELVLRAVKELMEDLQLNYQFGVWKGDLQWPFWTGEITPGLIIEEFPVQAGTFNLTVTADARTRMSDLIDTINDIHKYLGPAGRHFVYSKGVVSLWFDRALPIPSDIEALKKFQITLSYKEVTNNE